MLAVSAPAKLNLTLEVLGKRPDGFHEIRSVIQSINLCDCLRFQLNQEVIFKSDMPDWHSEKSLVSGAASLLQETSGYFKGATIEVEKRIPLMSGMGGDSSDAAAVLRGLNELWGLGLSQGKLLELAARLGSDVSFFLYGGTALAEGRGEAVTPLPPLPWIGAVLVVPDVPRLPGKTKRLYASLEASHYTDGQITGRLVKTLREEREFKPSLLFNTFENVAFAEFSGLKVYREHLLKLGAEAVHLAGSGPTLFTLLKDKAQAEDLATRCQQHGMEVYLVETGR
jgi:4-diphosphocytidyl-2-C-methyl-D-erythritol kinase